MLSAFFFSVGKSPFCVLNTFYFRHSENFFQTAKIEKVPKTQMFKDKLFRRGQQSFCRCSSFHEGFNARKDASTGLAVTSDTWDEDKNEVFSNELLHCPLIGPLLRHTQKERERERERERDRQTDREMTPTLTVVPSDECITILVF